jgi:Transglutaminase-like superfamily
MMNWWRTFGRLNGYQRGLAMESAAALAATWVGLRLAGYRRWRRWLEHFVPDATAHTPREARASANASAPSAQAREVARLESAAAQRLPWRTNCLEQSLVLWWLLRRRGIAAELRIGARKQEGTFEAHAWVEVAGTPIDLTGENHRHFVPFDGPLGAPEPQAPPGRNQ